MHRPVAKVHCIRSVLPLHHRVGLPRRPTNPGTLKNPQRLSRDIDLLVILDDDAPADHLTLRYGWQSLRGYQRPVDVIPVREAVYRRKAKIAGALAHEVSLDRIAVYERA
jgi:hypothetical protein